MNIRTAIRERREKQRLMRRKAEALDAVMDTLEYLKGQHEMETNIRLIIAHYLPATTLNNP